MQGKYEAPGAQCNPSADDWLIRSW